MEKQTEEKLLADKQVIVHRSYFKPITENFEDESCQYCTYSEQDIDTFPCAKCHTRH